MSHFRFRLDSLLRIREALARQEENRLAALLAQRNLQEASRTEIRERRSHVLLEQQDSAAAGTDGAALQLTQVQLCAFESYVREIERKLQLLGRDIQAQQLRYAEARREVKKLVRLQSNALEEWQRESARREQHGHDEMFLIRSVNEKRPKL